MDAVSRCPSPPKTNLHVPELRLTYLFKRNRATGRNETRTTADLGRMGDRFMYYRPEDGLAMVDNRVQEVMVELARFGIQVEGLRDAYLQLAVAQNDVPFDDLREELMANIEHEIKDCLRIMRDTILHESNTIQRVNQVNLDRMESRLLGAMKQMIEKKQPQREEVDARIWRDLWFLTVLGLMVYLMYQTARKLWSLVF